MSSGAKEIRYIEWVDSAQQSGWHHDDAFDDHGVAGCRSVGFVMRETDDEVLLGQSQDYRHGNWSDVIAIPKVAITKSTTLRKARS